MSDEKTVTILGRGKSWKKCPFDGEIWAAASVLVEPGMEDKHYDLLFAFDNPHRKIGVKNETESPLNEIISRAKKRAIPIISSFPYADERYPLLNILMEFEVSYLKNTISYMIALAISRGYRMLHLYGVDQDEELDGSGTPYSWNKPFVTYWLGVARGRGVKHTIAHLGFPHLTSPEMNRIYGKVFASPKKKEEYYAMVEDDISPEKEKELFQMALDFKEFKRKKEKELCLLEK